MKTAKVENYTAEMTANVVAEYKKGVAVAAIAEQVGKSLRSVVAKLARERNADGSPVYTKKAYTAKDGTKAESKADIVAKIATALGCTAEDVGSLEAATKQALKLVFEGLEA